MTISEPRMLVVNDAERLFDDELHADRGREVHDDVAAVHQLVDHELVEHRTDLEAEARVIAETARFSSRPVDKSSSTTTLSPRSRSRSLRCEPMKPAPPVMRYVCDMECRASSKTDGVDNW